MPKWPFIHPEDAWSLHLARRSLGRKITQFWVDFALCQVSRWFITGSIWDLKVPKWAFFHPESAWSHKTSLETQCKLIGRPKPYPNRWKVKITRNEFSLIYGKSTLRIFYMLFMDLWGITHQKILVGNPGRKSLLAPGVQAPKTTFLPILGVKNPENQKFFFLQISIFLGPIDGINDIFWSGLPFWLYSES